MRFLKGWNIDQLIPTHDIQVSAMAFKITVMLSVGIVWKLLV